MKTATKYFLPPRLRQITGCGDIGALMGGVYKCIIEDMYSLPFCPLALSWRGHKKRPRFFLPPRAELEGA